MTNQLDEILRSVDILKIFIEYNNYKGYDPYDALKSPVFKLPVFGNSKLIRFGFQQFLKRCPINLRSLLYISKGYNPVTLGLCIQAFGYLSKVYDKEREEYIVKAEKLINELIILISKNYSGACWGYDFDWEARNGSISAFKPNLVATGIITNALFEFYSVTKNQKAKELILSAVKFVVNDLNRTINGNTFCFSYSPFDKQRVLNANMKGARILTQAYYLSGNKSYIDEAKSSVAYVVDKQNKDGSWHYSNNSLRIDNYHTGYVLECLAEFIKYSGDEDYKQNLENGFNYFKNNFIENNGFPRFFNDSKYPLDCTAGGQSILTLIRFEEIEIALKVAIFMIENMQDSDGYFYFRKYKIFKNKISYMRWSDAWMFAAMSKLTMYLT